MLRELPFLLQSLAIQLQFWPLLWFLLWRRRRDVAVRRGAWIGLGWGFFLVALLFAATAVYLPRIYVPSLPGFALVTALAIDVLYQNRPRLTWALAVVAIAGNLGLAVFNDSLAVSPPFLSGGFFQPWRDLGIMLP